MLRAKARGREMIFASSDARFAAFATRWYHLGFRRATPT
jgi:hypothetical protein